MRRWIQQTTGARGLFATLLLLALAIRAVIPAGYMPVATGHGFVIEVCTGTGPARMLVELPHGTSDPAPVKRSPCDYGVLGTAILGGDVAQVPAATILPEAPRTRPLPQAVALVTPPYLSPPLRGPPAA